MTMNKPFHGTKDIRLAQDERVWMEWLFFFISPWFFVSSRATQELSEGGRRALETIEALWEEGRADGTAEWASGPAFPALPERPGDKIASV